MIDLADTIGVDLYYIEKQAEQISKGAIGMETKSCALIKSEKNEKVERESVMNTIKKYKDKVTSQSRGKIIKEIRDKYLIN